MEWRKDFETGIRTIDNEHHKLVLMITKLQNSLEDGFVTPMTGLIIKDIVDYTKYHFSSEELEMEKINYPGLVEHHRMHENLIESVVMILKRIKAGEQITTIDLIAFLKKWLQDHILEEDKKIGDFYRKMKEEAKSNNL